MFLRFVFWKCSPVNFLFGHYVLEPTPANVKVNACSAVWFSKNMVSVIHTNYCSPNRLVHVSFACSSNFNIVVQFPRLTVYYVLEFETFISFWVVGKYGFALTVQIHSLFQRQNVAGTFFHDVSGHCQSGLVFYGFRENVVLHYINLRRINCTFKHMYEREREGGNNP